MDNPLITTIIPTYRRPKLLKRAIESALNQTYSLIQVRVYDNASNDGTQRVVDEFSKKDSRVKYHCHPQNIGMMGNYEYALKEVDTPYFSLLSDDDVIFPWFYEEALQRLQQYPQAGFCACSTIIMTQQGQIIRVPLDLWSREGLFESPDGLLEMISKYPVPTCILFPRKILNEIPIDKNNGLTWDCDFLQQIAARYPILINKRPCGIFLHHEASYSNAQDFQNWKAAYSTLEQRLDQLAHLSPSVKKVAHELIENDLRMTKRAFTIRFLLNKQFDEACAYAEIFREKYGSNRDSLLLLTACRICKMFTPLIYLLYFLRKIKKMKNKKLQDYKIYAKWLEIEA